MIVVTGGSGFIGSHLASRLVEVGEEVLNIDIRKPKRNACKSVQCDIRDYDGLVKCVRSASVVFHLAAQVSVQKSLENPEQDFSHNALGTLNVLEAAEAWGAKRVVYTSSAAIYGNPVKLPISESHPLGPISPYGASKLRGEQYVLLYGRMERVEGVSLRLFNVYGKGQNPEYAGVVQKFADAAKAGKEAVLYGDGKQTRDFVSVHDVVGALMLAAEKKNAAGKAMNIGSGNEITLLELAREVEGAAGKKLRITRMPVRKGDIKKSVADISLARKVLGFRPKVKMREGLKELF